MSYTRSYTEYVSTTVSYPASQNGGSKTVSIPVNINIHVDTHPFDHSVAGCVGSVSALTASVVATEAAEVASRRANAKKIAGTVVSGFFKYTRSEISQQTSELAVRLEATINHLRQLAKSVADKKAQLYSDFNRIADRYTKLFHDLDNELNNRITAIDRPVFQFRKKLGEINEKYFGNGGANMVTVFQKEGGLLQTMILTSRVKTRAFDAIQSGKDFLAQQQTITVQLKKNTHENDRQGDYLVPVCFMDQSMPDGNRTERVFHVFQQKKSGTFADDQAVAGLFAPSSVRWTEATEEQKELIRNYFLQYLASTRSGSKPDEDRVIQTAGALFEKLKYQTLS